MKLVYEYMYDCSLTMFQGSGKTLAFGIPLIHYILERKEHLEKEENEPVSDFGPELEDISDQLIDNVEDTGDDDEEEEDGEDDEEGEDDSGSDIGSDNIVSGMDFDDNGDIEVEDNDGDDDGSSEDEQLEELAVG